MRHRERGATILETAMFLPFLLLLLVGMAQIGKITYTYYTLKKTLYAAATFLASAQGVDFCNDETGLIAAAKSFALSGAAGGDGASYIGLTADQIQVTPECVSSTGDLGTCDTPCDAVTRGASRPDFVIVSIPDGYLVTPRFPFMLVDPIRFRPEIRLPFGGT